MQSLSFGSDEENFCATVPKDGRSYSPTLFSQTVRVLKKINKPGDMIVAFGLLADKVKVSFDLEAVCLTTLKSKFVLWIFAKISVGSVFIYLDPIHNKSYPNAGAGLDGLCYSFFKSVSTIRQEQVLNDSTGEEKLAFSRQKPRADPLLGRGTVREKG